MQEAIEILRLTSSRENVRRWQRPKLSQSRLGRE
jgi:hypothetical protein